MVWIYRDRLQKQTHCQNTERFSFSTSTVGLSVYYSYANLRQVFYFTTAMQWPWNARKGIKTCHDKIFLPQSIRPSLLRLYLLPTPFLTSCDRAGGESDSSPFTVPGKAQCVYVCMLPHPPVIQHGKKTNKAAPAVSCAVLEPYLSK